MCAFTDLYTPQLFLFSNKKNISNRKKSTDNVYLEVSEVVLGLYINTSTGILFSKTNDKTYIL